MQKFQVFNNLIELVTSCGNYSQYRKRFAECSGFRFPILGVHLKDLIAVHVALPDWVDKEKTRVNLTKTQQLYAILQELALIQNTPPSIEANMDLLNLLTVSGQRRQGRANWPPGKEDKRVSSTACSEHSISAAVICLACCQTDCARASWVQTVCTVGRPGSVMQRIPSADIKTQGRNIFLLPPPPFCHYLQLQAYLVSISSLETVLYRKPVNEMRKQMKFV